MHYMATILRRETHPLQARLAWITKLSKWPFVGSNALAEIKKKGIKKS